MEIVWRKATLINQMPHNEFPEQSNSQPQIIRSHRQVKISSSHQATTSTIEEPPDLRVLGISRVGLRDFHSYTETRPVRNRSSPIVRPLRPCHWPNGQTMQERLDPRAGCDLQLCLDTSSKSSEIGMACRNSRSRF